MSNDDNLFSKRWELIGKRYKEMYPEIYQFTRETCKKIQEIFEKISPNYGEEVSGDFRIDEDGDVRCSEAFPFMLGAIGEMINKEIKKVHRYLKYAIPELENLIECPYCRGYNPPDASYCICCTKKMYIDEKNGKKE